MHVLVVPDSYVALDASLARLLAAERQRRPRSIAPAGAGASGPRRPWSPAELALFAASGFFLASLALRLLA